MSNLNLILGDCSERMQSLEPCSVNMVMTSPPYDCLRKYNSDTCKWDFNVFKVVANQLFRVVCDGGVVVWNVNDQVHNGSKSGTSFRQVLYFMDIGFKLNDTMIWRKKNPMPQVRQPRYAQCFEFMFIMSKGKPMTFNPIMRDCKCAGSLYESSCKNIGGESGRTNKKFTINSQTPDWNVWEIAVAQNKTLHPAVFPYELARRHIITWSNENDVVLDPFMGSGTTGVACVNTNRNFIGIEKEEKYFNIAKERIEKALETPVQKELF